MQRAIEFVQLQDWVPDGHEKLIVLSGGVACNGYLRKHLAYVAEHYEFKLKSPPPKLLCFYQFLCHDCSIRNKCSFQKFLKRYAANLNLNLKHRPEGSSAQKLVKT